MTEKLSAGVSRTEDPGGRAALRLEGSEGTTTVSPTGAQVLSWRSALGEVLWTASKPEFAANKPVRGGVPVVFPWFGDHPKDAGLPAHGFARTLEWRLVHDNDGPEVVLEATDDDATRAIWPHAFRLRLYVGVTASLRLMLAVENTGDAPFSCELALHTYFDVGDVETASVHGLEGVTCIETATAPEKGWDQKKPLHFRAETDRIFQGVPERLELRAPALKRNITLKTAGARSAIVWNPWVEKTARLSQMAPDDWKRFCCIESANVRDNALHLKPGESHALSLRIECSEA
jgi:glucose-6-phosphate 1-epimerase